MGRVRLYRDRVRGLLAPNYEELVADRDRALGEIGLLAGSLHAAHEGIAHLQADARDLRERLDEAHRAIEQLHRRAEEQQLRTDGLQERLDGAQQRTDEVLPRVDLLEDGLHEARRLNLRIAELTDLVTEVVLPLHDREIDADRFAAVHPDAL